jgi:hypothetical protein
VKTTPGQTPIPEFTPEQPLKQVIEMWQMMAAPILQAQAAWLRQSADLIGGAKRGERKTKT